MRSNKFFILGIVLCVSGCASREEKLFTELPSADTQIEFVNQVTDEPGFNIFNYRNFYNGGGVAIGDINNDGLSDIFLVSNMRDSKLYVNRGGFRFDDITEKAGVNTPKAWSTGVTFADVNGDGLLDIYVCNSGNRETDDRSNELFINNGDETFTERAEEYGLADKGFSTHAAFFDFDRDGDLDMYLLNNSFIPVGSLNYRNFRHERDNLGGHKFFRNDGTKFTDISEAAGIYGSIIGFGLGITIGDVNDDNWLDIYISNDFYERDYLYINNHDGTFKEDVKQQMPHISLSSMGADIADINNDGTLDIFVTDMLPGDDTHLKQISSFEGYDLYQRKLSLDYHHQVMQNMLQLNNGDNTFSEVARIAGVDATDWSWGALIFDMNNDGFKDIFVANGILRDLTDQDFLRFLADKSKVDQTNAGKPFDVDELVKQMPSRPIANYAFLNTGELNFSNQASSWGLDGPGFSNGAAYGDLDNDGDLDLVVNNQNSPVSVYKNSSVEKNKTHFLRVRLKGDGGNRNGIGAKVKLYRDGSLQYLQQMPNRGFQSSVDHVLVFGLGNEARIDSLNVTWPDDKMQVLYDVNVDTEVVIQQANADRTWRAPVNVSKQNSFTDITSQSKLNYTHRENNFADYYRDPLLKQKYSTQGPALATGDVNGDGTDDVLTGNPITLFTQNSKGIFEETKQAAFALDTLGEAIAAVLTDVDNDKDLDLFVATGSNEFNENDPALRDRLYLNNGKGNFEKSDRIPSLSTNASCVAAADFDNDGDVDLFIGSRLVSGQYGFSPPSYLYINDGHGNFKNQTKRFLPESELGMITDATWTDIDGDSYPELVVVGDWMPIKIFKNQSGKSLTPWNKLPGNTEGWWNCVKAADIDNDGDTDFIVGNLGRNSRIRADSLHPAEMYVSDFDKNGAVEQIITCVSQDGKNYPMVLKHDLERQLPFIKKRFLNYGDYAGKNISQIMKPEELNSAEVRRVVTANTSILINEGNGSFVMRALPTRVQISTVNAIETLDYDNDGNIDILLGGNFFDVLPEIGRYDANYGIVLHGKGKGEFEILLPKQSGFFTKGQVRKMKLIKRNGKDVIVVAKNNDSIQLYEAD